MAELTDTQMNRLSEATERAQRLQQRAQEAMQQREALLDIILDAHGIEEDKRDGVRITQEGELVVPGEMENGAEG